MIEYTVVGQVDPAAHFHVRTSFAELIILLRICRLHLFIYIYIGNLSLWGGGDSIRAGPHVTEGAATEGGCGRSMGFNLAAHWVLQFRSSASRQFPTKLVTELSRVL